MSSDGSLSTAGLGSDYDGGSDWGEWSTLSESDLESGNGSQLSSDSIPSLICGDAIASDSDEIQAGISPELFLARSKFPKLDENPLMEAASKLSIADDNLSDDWTLASKRMELMDKDRELIEGLEHTSSVPPKQSLEDGESGPEVHNTVEPQTKIPDLLNRTEQFVESQSREAATGNGPLSLGRPPLNPLRQPPPPHFVQQTGGYPTPGLNAPPLRPTGISPPLPRVPRQCNVCFRVKSLYNDFPPRPLSEVCRPHGPNTCTECVKRTVDTSLRYKRHNQVGCPECPGILNYETVMEYVSPDMRERVERMTLFSALQDDKDFVWCSARCGSGQIHEGGVDRPIVSCTSCSKRTCFYHKTPWHTGVTCDEIDRISKSAGTNAPGQQQQPEEEEDIYTSDDIPRPKNNKAPSLDDLRSRNAIQQTTKACPSCDARIEKAGGCAHMSCFNCLFQFCWECLADYDKILKTDNTAHKQDCRFHTRNLLLRS